MRRNSRGINCKHLDNNNKGKKMDANNQKYAEN